jgi:hypothetical protein
MWFVDRFWKFRCIIGITMSMSVVEYILAVAQDGHLQTVTIPEAAYVQFALLTS